MGISARSITRIVTLCVLGAILGLVPVAITSLSCSTTSPLTAITILALFFGATFVTVLRRDVIFAFYYGFLYLYTVFTQIGYVFYPEAVAAISAGQYYGLEWFYPYWAFILLSFLLIYILFLIVDPLERRGKFCLPLFLEIETRTNTNVLFYALIVAHNLVMLYFFLSRYSQLSYYSQHVLKHNKLFFYGFYLYELTLLALYVKYRMSPRGSASKVASFLLLVASMAVFLAIAARTGQRIEFVAFFLGLSMYVFASSRRGAKLGTAVKLLGVGGIVLLFANALRSCRGGATSLTSIVSALATSPVRYIVPMDLKSITFQDYLSPSLTLITSMYYSKVFPLEVLKSNLINLLVLVDYPTLGEQLSRLVDPEGWAGYGYYILTEGFNTLGWAGVVYNALVFNVGLLLWKRFAKTNHEEFNRYMMGVIATGVFNIVRGQSLFFIKATYFSFLPAIVLFCTGTGTRVRLLSRASISGDGSPRPSPNRLSGSLTVSRAP